MGIKQVSLRAISNLPYHLGSPDRDFGRDNKTAEFHDDTSEMVIVRINFIISHIHGDKLNQVRCLRCLDRYRKSLK